MGRKRKKHLRLIRFILLLAVFGIAVYAGMVGYICIRERKVANVLADNSKYDAIIVLGAQVRPDGTPSVQLTWRLDAAADAYTQYPAPVVVCGAQGGDEPYPEAEVMKQYLVSKGIPEGMILADPKSFNTNQNLENSKKLLASEYPEAKRVLIVTSDYHVPRSLAIASDLGYEAEGLGSRCLPEYWLKNHTREALAWCKYLVRKYLHLPL